MKKGFWSKVRRFAALGCVALSVAGASYAQDPLPQTPANDPIAELKARMERLEKENQELRQIVHGQAPVSTATGGEQDKSSVEKIVADYLKAEDKKKKDAEAANKKKLEDEGFAVGSDMKMSTRWDKYGGLRFETANKDFVVHFGTRLQLDSVFFDQSESLKPATQLGNFQDGIFFRRVRFQAEGTFWEVGEFNTEVALEGVQQGIVNLDEFWVGIQKIPFIGSVRIGHYKVPQGFEGDMVSSSKAMTFLERSAYTDAFYQNFGTGIWTGNSVMDQHMTWSAMLFRQERGSNGDDFADGEYAGAARLTFLPMYENDGRCLLHVGVSGSWRDARKALVGTNPTGNPSVQFRARPQMRDAVGDFASGSNPGNSARMVDTGSLRADSASIYGAELFFVNGPFSLQAEYGMAIANNTHLQNNVVDDLSFNGGYVQASYFLTGEHRGYDRRLGREASNYVVGPNTNAWAVRDDAGGLSNGIGAWEVAARWNYLDLNDGPINGGIFKAAELGLNWYLNPNWKIQFEYNYNHREDKKATGTVSEPGWVTGFGIRTQFYF